MERRFVPRALTVTPSSAIAGSIGSMETHLIAGRTIVASFEAMHLIRSPIQIAITTRDVTPRRVQISAWGTILVGLNGSGSDEVVVWANTTA